MKKLPLLLAALALILAAFVYVSVSRPLPTDFKEVSFRISGQPFQMKNGVSTDGTVRYFGNDLRVDVDGDGAEDVAFLITQNPGGSGTFFFAVAALKRGDGYKGSDAVLIGDRIAPQTTAKGPGRSIVINYADRKPTDPMTAQPSVGKSLHLLLDPKTLQFGELVQNFEGESR